MATFITLVNLTQKGIEDMKNQPKRLEAFRELCKSMGAELKGFYMTMGRYDLVAIVEAPNAETMLKANLATAMRGNVRTETLMAFPDGEYQKVISELP